MRRQLQLQDCELPSYQWNVIVGGEGGRKQFGFNTEYKTSKVQVQTVIVNGNKESFGCQIDQKIMARQLNVQKKPKPIEKGQQNVQSEINNQQQTPQQQKVNQQNPHNLSEQTLRKVDRFMRKVVPLMDKQLNENLPLYSNFGLGDQKQFFKKETRLSYTLQNVDSLQQQGLVVSDVSWNSTSVMLAASYSKKQHTSTCSHKSMICLWSLFKRTFNPNKPDIIYTNVILFIIKRTFHPKRPSVLAVGNYVGEILLYDLTKKEQLIAKTNVDDYFHRDVVSQVTWWPFKPPGKTQVVHNILSLSTDGKILLWQVPNIIFGEETFINNNAKLKNLFKTPIKGFSILRKKQGVIIPVSALSMSQSKSNKNVFIIGSEGGSILKANLTNINHYINTEGKILLDMQQQVKFKKQVYPFLLNVPQKEFRQLKEFIQKSAKSNNLNIISTVDQIYQLKPKLTLLYPNSITFAYEPLSYPISQISFNRYGLFIANGCDGYSRLYLQNRKEHLQSFEQGYQWGWINEGTKIGGFIGQEFAIIDWVKGNTLWSVPVGEGLRWKESMGNSIAVICEDSKIKVIQVGDRILRQDENFSELFLERLNELTQSST